MTEYEIKEAIIDRLHEYCGICGHCNKKECAGKKSNYSKLPAKLDTADVLRAIDLIFK